MLHGLSFIPAYWWSNLGCNDRQHRSQEFEVLLYAVRAEHETEEVVRTYQRLRLGDTLPSWQSQRSGRCLEPKELLQQLDDRRKSAKTSKGVVHAETRASRRRKTQGNEGEVQPRRPNQRSSRKVSRNPRSKRGYPARSGT